MTLVPRPGIMGVRPYVGGESSLPGRGRAIRLASNENPLGASPRAVAFSQDLSTDSRASLIAGWDDLASGR